MGTREDQESGPAICPRCGNWYPAKVRRCPVHRVVLVLPDERVRRFGPEDLSSTIQTVVEIPAKCRPHPRGRGRWPTRKPLPLRFFEATTRPGEVPLDRDPVGSHATVIPEPTPQTDPEE